MKRRIFLKQSVGAIGMAGMVPVAGQAAATTNAQGERTNDRWHQLGTGTTGLPNRRKTVEFDVAVVGGGLAGVCAAVAAARNGAKAVLIQDRPVLGGNASSEVRVNVNGVAYGGWSLDEHRPGGIENPIVFRRSYSWSGSAPYRCHAWRSNATPTSSATS